MSIKKTSAGWFLHKWGTFKLQNAPYSKTPMFAYKQAGFFFLPPAVQSNIYRYVWATRPPEVTRVSVRVPV